MEVTLPPGAVPGTTIEFSAPQQEDASAEPPMSESSAEAAVPCRVYWEGRPQCSAGEARNGAGLSNAAVDRVYAARLPPGHPPKEPLHVEFAPGIVLAVPVPVGARPGGDVLFRAPDEEDDAAVEVLKRGKVPVTRAAHSLDTTK